MTSLAPKRINVHLLGLDHAVYWKYKDPNNDSAFTGWHRTGGIWSYEAVSCSRVLNELSVFMVDTKHCLQQSNFNLMTTADLGPFVNLGGKLLGPPTVCNSNGTLHIFHIGTDHAIYYKAWDGVSYTPSDTSFDKLGGCFSHITAVSAGEEEVSVFGIGLNDDCLYRYHWTAAENWAEIEKMPGRWAGCLTSISQKNGSWDVFGLDLVGKINHLELKDGKVSEKPHVITGLFISVDAVSWGPGRIDLFAVGYDSCLFHKACDNGNWQGWENLNVTPGWRPTPVSHSPGALCVIYVDKNCTLFVKVRDAASGSWWDPVNIEGTVISRPG